MNVNVFNKMEHDVTQTPVPIFCIMPYVGTARSRGISGSVPGADQAGHTPGR